MKIRPIAIAGLYPDLASGKSLPAHAGIQSGTREANAFSGNLEVPSPLAARTSRPPDHAIKAASRQLPDIWKLPPIR